MIALHATGKAGILAYVSNVGMLSANTSMRACRLTTSARHEAAWGAPNNPSMAFNVWIRSLSPLQLCSCSSMQTTCSADNFSNDPKAQGYGLATLWSCGASLVLALIASCHASQGFQAEAVQARLYSLSGCRSDREHFSWSFETTSIGGLDWPACSAGILRPFQDDPHASGAAPHVHSCQLTPSQVHVAVTSCASHPFAALLMGLGPH